MVLFLGKKYIKINSIYIINNSTIILKSNVIYI